MTFVALVLGLVVVGGVLSCVRGIGWDGWCWCFVYGRKADRVEIGF